MSHNTIKAKNLCYTYPDNREALKDISFSIEEGETVALVGANGAGKSTLLMQFVGVILPSSGIIEVGHFPIKESTLSLVRQKVGMVFQDSDNQLFMNRVYDDVAFGPRNYGIPEGKIDEIVMTSLRRVGIEHLADRAPYRLSGGEKKAAAIAAILSMSPDVLVLDEPTTGLDPKARRRLIDTLSSFEHTKLIATHDMDMVMDLCERTIILNNGQIAADGPTAEIFRNKVLLEECSLEQPASLMSCRICNSVRK